MTASGELSWPSVGIFPWPPTVANASAYRLGRTHNPMPARVMKKGWQRVLIRNVRYSPARRPIDLDRT